MRHWYVRRPIPIPPFVWLGFSILKKELNFLGNLSYANTDSLISLIQNTYSYEMNYLIKK